MYNILIFQLLAFLTNNGIPGTGLNVTIKIREVESGTVIADWEVMTEIGDGWYKYDFPYNYTKEYVATIDGSDILSDSERFVYAAKDNSLHDTASVVWNAQVDDYQQPGSFGEIQKVSSNDLKRALGLMHENIYIDNPVYDEWYNLISARVRIYSVNTSVGTDNDVIGTYLITADGNGCGQFSHWSQITI